MNAFDLNLNPVAATAVQRSLEEVARNYGDNVGKYQAEVTAFIQASREQAAEQIKQAWQSLTDSLMGEVQRIRGQMEQDSFGGLASAQARLQVSLSSLRLRAL